MSSYACCDPRNMFGPVDRFAVPTQLGEEYLNHHPINVQLRDQALRLVGR